jgi:hypothetical protein
MTKINQKKYSLNLAMQGVDLDMWKILEITYLGNEEYAVKLVKKGKEAKRYATQEGFV